MQQSLPGYKLIGKLTIFNDLNDGGSFKERFGTFMPVEQ
jgi:hypothetical protein